MYELTKDQKTLLSTVLMEYLNVGDWKELFAQTDCEEFAQQHTQFYEDVNWASESLENDSAEAVAFILNKDNAYLKIIWNMPGVQTMALRKDENFHSELEALVEGKDQQASSLTNTPSPVTPDENQDPFKTLGAAKELIQSEKTEEAYRYIHSAMRSFFQLACLENEIPTNNNDSVSLLFSKIIAQLKQQENIQQNVISLSMLQTATVLTETIDDLSYQSLNDKQLNSADIQYIVYQSEAVMIYIRDLMEL